jgi:hypothetical protein
MSDGEQRRIDGVRAVVAEQGAQLRKWGEQKHPDLYLPADKFAEDRIKAIVDARSVSGSLTWQHIFEEEWTEARAAGDLEQLREELVQCAAVLLSWVNDIDRRGIDGDILTQE